MNSREKFQYFHSDTTTKTTMDNVSRLAVWNALQNGFPKVRREKFSFFLAFQKADLWVCCSGNCSSRNTTPTHDVIWGRHLDSDSRQAGQWCPSSFRISSDICLVSDGITLNLARFWRSHAGTSCPLVVFFLFARWSSLFLSFQDNFSTLHCFNCFSFVFVFFFCSRGVSFTSKTAFQNIVSTVFSLWRTCSHCKGFWISWKDLFWFAWVFWCFFLRIIPLGFSDFWPEAVSSNTTAMWKYNKHGWSDS